MSWLWHGFNPNPRERSHQCYYEWHCLYCYLKLILFIISLRLRRNPRHGA